MWHSGERPNSERTGESKLHVGLLYFRVRRDGKLLPNELHDRGHEVTKIGVRKEQPDLMESPESSDGPDVVVDRRLVTSRNIYITRFLKSCGIPVVNPYEIVDTCADKARNSLAPTDAGVPAPNTRAAFAVDPAVDIIEEFNYPCVLKPVVGS